MYQLGTRSKEELKGVHPDLVAVVNRAIKLTSQDFSVHDGLRTVTEQRRLVRSGASKTMNSKHLSGRAVDLVPYINGRLRWEWEPIFEVVIAVRAAATELDVPLTWGSAWDRNLTESSKHPRDMRLAYAKRRSPKRAFLDGPHFELRASC